MIKRKKRGNIPVGYRGVPCLPDKGSTVLARSIGIGGHLAMPPLPHHRAYGSVPRRFGGLSTRQLFHRDQAETTEASFGEGAMQSFREAQPPRSLGAEDGRTGRPFGDLEPTELTIALASRLPLDPGDTTQAPSDPAIQRWQLVPLAETEVPGPAPHERVQVGNHLLQADAPMPPGQFANSVFEPGHGLVGDASPEHRIILDRVSRPTELHRQPLAEPSMRLSPHSAPIRQTCRSFRSASARRVLRCPLRCFGESDSRGSYEQQSA